MLTHSPEVKKTVIDYDITFDSGMIMPLTLDPSVGDTITWDHPLGVIEVHRAPVPSLNNPDNLLPAEDITIFLAHVVAVQKRSREVVELSPEQRAEWKRVLQEMPKSVN